MVIEKGSWGELALRDLDELYEDGEDALGFFMEIPFDIANAVEISGQERGIGNDERAKAAFLCTAAMLLDEDPDLACRCLLKAILLECDDIAVSEETPMLEAAGMEESVANDLSVCCEALRVHVLKRHKAALDGDTGSARWACPELKSKTVAELADSVAKKVSALLDATPLLRQERPWMEDDKPDARFEAVAVAGLMRP